MSATQTSAPFVQEAQVVVEVSENYTASNRDRIIDVAGVRTIKLPPNPVRGQKHRILAGSGAVTVDGNGHTIAATINTVPTHKAVDFLFSTSDTWLAYACSTDRG